MAAVAIAATAALALVVAACGSSSSSSSASSSASPGATPGPTLTPVPLTADTIVGAGASFPAPLYQKWGADYQGVKGVKLNYQSIGSGGGISAVESKTVDFGASDAPLQEADLTANNLAQFPMVVGGVVIVVHLNGVADGQLKLTPDVLASIYMGKTTMWNDASITSLNPGVSLPATKINVVHRSDSSGTTWIFTHYLTDAAGSIWTAGADKSITWPIGIGANKNDGVAASVQQLNDSIGYVEYAYAKQTGMTTTQLQNKAGAWVKPSIASFQRCCRQRQLEGLAAEHVHGARQPAGRRLVADHRRVVHPRAEELRPTRHAPRTCSSSSTTPIPAGQAAATALDYVPLPAKRLQPRPEAGLADHHRQRGASLALIPSF